MKVQKRGGRGYESVKFDKITARLRQLCVIPTLPQLVSVDVTQVALLTINDMYDGISTEELDMISARAAEGLKLTHPEYSCLAERILVSNLHKTTPDSFAACMKHLHNEFGLLSNVHCQYIADNADLLDAMIQHDRDYSFDYMGYKTLEKGYMMNVQVPVTGPDGKPIYTDGENDITDTERIIIRGESRVVKRGSRIALKIKTVTRVHDRPQYVFMREAVAIYMGSGENEISNIKSCYELLSGMRATHATPTMSNACTESQQLGSCFLLQSPDSIEGIMSTLANCSRISKYGGGVGIGMHNIRHRGSTIASTGGQSSGLPRQLKIYNEAARCWDQGGKRPGAFAIYVEPWHGDILDFLKLKLNQGSDTERARDLFYALWIPDLYMKRIERDESWSLFSSNTAPGLCDVYDGMDVCTHCRYCANPNYAKYIELEGLSDGCQHEFIPVDAFTQLYTRYEEDGLAVGTLPAREILNAVCNMQRESGTPYVMFKDHVNRMSNQKNVDTIRSSNLCCEIMEVSTPESYACCTLASVNLKMFVTDNGFDHEHLHSVVRHLTRNLDRIIDVNAYPVIECVANAVGYRQIGIGIQALADTFAMLRIPFVSAEAEKLDLEIAETIYHAAVTESAALAQLYGSHVGFEGSPASHGILHIDMWENTHANIQSGLKLHTSGRYDWDAVRELVKHGLRNAQLLAFMPTVSTSQVMGSNESFEPFDANIYTKATRAGKFTVLNTAMVSHLMELGLWNESICRRIMNDGGSMSSVTEIPADVREIYKTVWEIKQSDLIRRSALRCAYVDQSQSLNIRLANNSNANLRAVFIAGWKMGLKTGSYYIRTRPAVEPIKTNIATVVAEAGPVCYKEKGCVACSS